MYVLFLVLQCFNGHCHESYHDYNPMTSVLCFYTFTSDEAVTAEEVCKV